MSTKNKKPPHYTIMTLDDAQPLKAAIGRVPDLDPIGARRLPWLTEPARRFVYREISRPPEQLAEVALYLMYRGMQRREQLLQQQQAHGRQRDLFSLPDEPAPRIIRPSDNLLIDVARPLFPELIWVP